MSAKRIPGQDARFGTLYVNASDYDQLAADNKRLREALQAIDRHNDNPARYDSYIDEVIKDALSGHQK